MKYYVDKENNVLAFYSSDVATIENIDQLREITFEEAELLANPPPTQDELDQQQEAENIAFLSSETRRTNEAIAVLDDAIEFEIATDEEIAQHKELRKYRLMLSRVPNQETWPLNPVWPECPEFFKTKE